MIRPPFVARVAAGIAVTAVEEARKLPTTAATLPMTAVSQVLQTTMRVQQSMTALAIKGDQAFALIHWTHDDEQPAWAVFDEDTAPEPAADGGSDDRAAGPGRFALYSLSPQDEGTPAKISTPKAAPAATNGASPVTSATTKSATSTSAVAEPEIAVVLDYGSLTLAQLRARLRSLSVEDLTTLLDYENATLARAPFQTMLTNRITTAKAK
ncbi:MULTISPECIES: lipid droplet-associated protein [unclassified Rhodococcus (in: high G+C Gram-positive bacteria)]|uniref:lipid droplet-associated protein n=1 Tax=unclassified Rhodococcus (in: high G+C Gram-positive bacteria) TaxID=192944 RepID=UPI00163B4A89|nr:MULTISPECIES: lipid droplet-associated protein [unclassified Rhodococcus (in: high G+C Gram-positive bacteria)]MBC2643097.1 lipid droplet-associated protein [Rhodococcus sp. 3A]MBC2892162.1 lipid droplet-associated protein [Rhodococcus sp. 4CII]